MKNLIKVVICSLLVVAISCKKEEVPSNLLPNVWATTELIIKTDTKEFVLDRNTFSLDLNLKPDGTYEYTERESGKLLKGSWELKSDNKTLIITESNSKPFEFEILELAKNYLTLGWKKIDLGKKEYTNEETEFISLYSQLMDLGGITDKVTATQPKWIQLQIKYVRKS